MWCEDRCFALNEILVFMHKDGEHLAKYEDFAGTISHTKLRCEINQIVVKHLGQLQIQINQIKERLDLQ